MTLIDPQPPVGVEEKTELDKAPQLTPPLQATRSDLPPVESTKTSARAKSAARQDKMKPMRKASIARPIPMPGQAPSCPWGRE